MTFPDTLTLSVTIDGDNVEGYILDGLITANDLLGAMADSWRMSLIDPVHVPVEWEEIIILDGATKLHGGYVLDVLKYRMDRNNSKVIIYKITCGSYAALLERRRAKIEYENKTDAYIIDDLLTTYASEIEGATYVDIIKTYVNKRFNRTTVYAAIDSLADDAGASWYVDEDKKLHFFLNEELSAV